MRVMLKVSVFPVDCMYICFVWPATYSLRVIIKNCLDSRVLMGNVEVAGPHDVICEADIQSNRKAYSRQCWGLLVNLLHALIQYQTIHTLCNNTSPVYNKEVFKKNFIISSLLPWSSLRKAFLFLIITWVEWISNIINITLCHKETILCSGQS